MGLTSFEKAAVQGERGLYMAYYYTQLALDKLADPGFDPKVVDASPLAAASRGER